jgi:drug/metabolite transporter (DMT)-like permease
VIEAIRIITVPVAILTYFIYPLLTGLAAAATGIEKLTWRGAATASGVCSHSSWPRRGPSWSSCR